jgi:hypothetical protein
MTETVLSKILTAVRRAAEKIKKTIVEIDFSSPSASAGYYAPESFFKSGIYGRPHF